MMQTKFQPTLDECKAIADLYSGGAVSLPVLIAKHRTSGKYIKNAILQGGGKILPPYRDRFVIAQERKQSMCDLYRGGASVNAIRKQFGYGADTIKNVLKASGVPKRKYVQPRLVLPPEARAEIAKLYRVERLGIATISKRLHHAKRLILEVLAAEGVPIGEKGPRARIFTDAETKDICHRYQSGESRKSIAKSYYTNISAIRRALSKQGLMDIRRVGPLHQTWKGGRHLTIDGYVLIRVPHDHWLRPHCQGAYMLEHRFVMAEYIGRPLLPEEQVHHVNGDRQFNLPINLQLRVGAHGSGVLMHCKDCGSHNIESLELPPGKAAKN